MNKKIVHLSLLTSLSILLSYLEVLINFSFIPYIKIGLSNIVILFCLDKYTRKEAFLVLVLKIFLTSFILGTFLNISFYLSLVGGLSSFLIMAIFIKFKNFSLIGISILGSVTHTTFQILSYSIINSIFLLYILSYLILISIVTGLITGLITRKVSQLLN